jgi:hypothetical protein
MENEAEKMKLMVKVEKAGITIPIERLKGLNEGDIVQVQIEKVYISKRIKKDLIQKLPFFLQSYVKMNGNLSDFKCGTDLAQICVIKLC